MDDKDSWTVEGLLDQGWDDEDEDPCPDCREPAHLGHAPDCGIAAELAALMEACPNCGALCDEGDACDACADAAAGSQA